MKIKEGFKVRDMAGEHVIIMHGKAGADMTRVIALNESSLFLWNRFKEAEFTVEDICNALLEEYEVDRETAFRDSGAWVEKLRECKLLDE